MWGDARLTRLALGLTSGVLLCALACDGDTPTNPNPTIPATPCTTGEVKGPFPGGTASRSQPVGISGGTFSASVTVAGDCQWSVTSDVPWAVLAGGPTFRGSQSVSYTVPPNTGAARTGRLTYSFSSTQGSYIVQDGRVSCATEISPAARSFLSQLSALEVRVFAPTGCKWAFEGNGSWLTVVPEDDRPSPWGDGNGTVVAVAAANTGGSPRTGTATIAGKTLTITQDGTETPACQYVFAPITHSFPAAGGTGQVIATTGPDCTWVFDEIGDAWIKPVLPGRYFRGPGAFVFSVDGNASAQSRTGMFWLSGTSAPRSTRVTVEQAAASCVYTVSPASSAWSSAGGRAGISVDARPGSCQWTAAADVSWIAIGSGNAGTGGGLVEFTVGAMPAGGPATRSGAVTVRGLSGLNPPAVHRVTQSW